MHRRLALVVALIACMIATSPGAQTGQGGASSDPVVGQSLRDAIRSTRDALELLEEDARVGLAEVEALFDRARNSLDDDAARQAIQDAYYDALGMLDAAEEAMRSQGRASAISALETAVAILERARDGLGTAAERPDGDRPG